MSIQLPDFFQKKLDGHPHELGLVHTALDTFGKWFANSRTPFFPDYTDHGEAHISSVLQTCAELIGKSARPTISSADVTILVWSVLLHDSALHLTPPVFQALIKGNGKDNCIPEFDHCTWPTLWEKFLFSAKRWSDQKIVDVFGDKLANTGFTISDPFERWENLGESDFKLIGEFIRINHPRLAHEFAVHGIPGTTQSQTGLPSTAASDWRDIAGAVARSHGVNLRSMLDYVEKKYQVRDYQSIHVIYLMALIRVSDYLQLHKERAPESVFQYRIIPSRISQTEWNAHHAIKNITATHQDPESVEVKAEPKDVKTYLRIREWLDGIQSELDSSWAVLGEVYGRFELSNLGLSWRRVRSNLDDLESFSGQVEFLPRRIRVEVARAELLSLLIRPLYGDDPSFGVRELMQNAIDAVKELYAMEAAVPKDGSPSVEVSLTAPNEDTRIATLTITDRGVGMTEEILIQYFLTAGASFRHSEQWQLAYETNDSKNNGQFRSRVERGGRFGIGSLAAFLIGNRIQVETRHVKETVGYKFTLGLRDEAVQIEKVNGLPHGTRITIALSSGVYERLTKDKQQVNKPGLWDWYLFEKPFVERSISRLRRTKLPRKQQVDLKSWHEVLSPQSFRMFWSYDEPGPRLACNGLFVSNSDKLPEFEKGHCDTQTERIGMPKLHVLDPDAAFPLNLTRTGITSAEYGCEHALYEDVMKDYIARILMTFPETPNDPSIVRRLMDSPIERWNSERSYRWNHSAMDCILTHSGFCLPFDSMLSALSQARKFLWIKLRGLAEADELGTSLLKVLTDWDCVVLEGGLIIQTPSQEWKETLGSYLKRLTVDFHGMEVENITWSSFKTDGFAQAVKKRIPTLWQENKSKYVENWRSWNISEYYREQWSKTRWLVHDTSEEDWKYPFKRLEEVSKPTELPDVKEILTKNQWNYQYDTGIIGRWWSDYFGQEWMPWNKAERLKKFADAKRRLAPYIARYE